MNRVGTSQTAVITGPSAGHALALKVSSRLEVVLGALFLWAAYNKLKNPALFAPSVRAFDIVPGFLPESASHFLVRFTVGAVPWVEVVCGVCLVLGLWSRAAAAALGALLVVFILLIVQALLRGLDVDCGCFGDLSPFCPKKVGACHIWQDVLMLAAAMFIALTPRWRPVDRLTPADLRNA